MNTIADVRRANLRFLIERDGPSCQMIGGVMRCP